ncbi:MAG TPA: acyltransferase, partial [Mycobacteriales bacterium]|nr:acyltransferase [Mycobacteriales bacterium]
MASYVTALEGVRAPALCFVIAIHAGLKPFGGGLYSVDMFFVLSGLLITSVLIREHELRGSISLPRFWARRVLRLMPVLIVAVVAFAAAATVLSPGRSARSYAHEALYALTYSMNVHQAHHPEQQLALGHTWTLAMEEQFYLVWPVVLVLALRWGGRRLAMTVAAVLAVASFTLLQLVPFGLRAHAVLPSVYFRPDTRAGGLMAGCLIALVLAAEVPPRLRGVLAAPATGLFASAVIVAMVTVPDFQHHRVPMHAEVCLGVPLATIASMALMGHLAVAPTSRLSRALSWRPLTRVGLVSYSIYLVHLPLMLLLERATTFAPLALFLTTLLGSIALAYVLRFTVELPLLPLQRRLSATTAKVPGPAAPTLRRSSLRAALGGAL